MNAGEYYLIETTIPEGFVFSPAPVHIIVDDTGIYADAGTANDGVVVERGVGNLVENMHEFAIDNDIDETLHNIIYTPQTGNMGSDGKLTWSVTTNAQQVHLAHHNVGDGGEHKGYVNENAGVVIYTTDQGWSRLLIQQCSEHRNSIVSNKDALGERDITNLFTKEVTVVIQNRRAPIGVELSGSKSLQKEAGDTAVQEERTLKENEFSFKLEPVEGAPMLDNADSLTVKNDADGMFVFPAITFETASNTEYKYKITEIKGDDSTVEYDNGYWIVTVKITVDDSTNVLSSEVSYAKYDIDGDLLTTTVNGEFINTYVDPEPIPTPTLVPTPTPTSGPKPTPIPEPTSTQTSNIPAAPLTGDSSNIGLWIMFVVVGTFGLAISVLLHKKETK